MNYHEVYESGQRIPDDEIAEWLADATEYAPRLFQADPVEYGPMARFIRAATLIVRQLQADIADEASAEYDGQFPRADR